MGCPPEALKSLANDLAQTLISDASGVIAKLRLIGLLTQPTSPSSPPPMDATRLGSAHSPANPDLVGIWERKLKDGLTFFARRIDMMGDWNYWANVGRIEAKGAARRVVLIGESVARGYFYDPQFTPAMALESILQSRLGEGELEVIDLARTNLYMRELAELARSALTLEPDAVVFLAGNNWRFSLLDSLKNGGVRDIIAVLGQEGVPGLKRFAEERLAADIRELVEEISSLYAANGVLPVWIVPEFNLIDWREPESNAPHLPDGANRRWLELFEAAKAALRADEIATAAARATEMVELDHGLCLTGLYMLAHCSERLGDREAERRYLEMARDALIWDPSRIVSPRAYTVVQETLRDEVTKRDGKLVDMPALFKEHLEGGLPDRRVFLDYCHLTSEGIRITMAGAAACLLHSFRGDEFTPAELGRGMGDPSNEVEGEVAFLAAVHNAHWWQADELVRHYCLQAVQSAPKIARVMTSFIDLVTRQAPMLMCKSAERISLVGSKLVQQYLLRHSHKQLDKVLLDAVIESLKKLGIDASQHLNNLRKQDHSVGNRDIDLLDPYYCVTTRQPQELRWVTTYQIRPEIDSDFYRAYWLESRFVFIGEAGCPVRLRLVCRLPGPGQSEETVSVAVNGRPLSEASVGRNWETWEVSVAGDVTQDGVNEVLVRWPIPEFPGDAALTHVAADLLNGIHPTLFPIFGEIHSFVATDARNKAP